MPRPSNEQVEVLLPAHEIHQRERQQEERHKSFLIGYYGLLIFAWWLHQVSISVAEETAVLERKEYEPEAMNLRQVTAAAVLLIGVTGFCKVKNPKYIVSGLIAAGVVLAVLMKILNKAPLSLIAGVAPATMIAINWLGNQVSAASDNQRRTPQDDLESGMRQSFRG
jgi:hypothetical protein